MSGIDSRPALEKAIALARADRHDSIPAEIVAPERSRAVAASVSRAEIPLPPGLDTAAALDWPAQSGFGPITLADIHDLLQVNAARDWIWFAAHNDLTHEQREILMTVPDWPRLRGGALGHSVADAIPRILAGEDRAWAEQFAARQFPDHDSRPPERAAW
jgi:hypothetical protein